MQLDTAQFSDFRGGNWGPAGSEKKTWPPVAQGTPWDGGASMSHAWHGRLVNQLSDYEQVAVDKLKLQVGQVRPFYRQLIVIVLL